MKYFVITAFILGLAIGGSGKDLEFSLTDIAHQECKGKSGQVVFFNSVKIDHPLGKNTCGDLHKVTGIDM
ncbi:MAG: hypothetical protein U0R17_04415 [Acidimicrobiia bacterium]